MVNVYLSIVAIVTGVALLSIANGLLMVLVSMRMTIESFPNTTIGMVVSGYSVGFLIGCIFAGRLIRATGHARAFAIFAGLNAVAALIYGLNVEPVTWFVLRSLSGFGTAGLFVIAESWLTEKIPTPSRGRVLGSYMISNKIAYGGGQLLLMAADPGGMVLFMVAALCFSLCLLPVVLSRGERPTIPELSGFGLRQLLQVSPVALFGCFIAGINNTSVVSLGPVFAVAVGLNTALVAWFSALIQLGSIFLQYPIGRLSDRADRRLALLAAAAGAGTSAVALWFAGDGPPWLLLVLATVYGGLSFTFYPICVAHAADQVEARHLVTVTGKLLLTWAMGSVTGPMLATLFMDRFGPAGLFLFIAGSTGLLLAFTLWRLWSRPQAGGPRPRET